MRAPRLVLAFLLLLAAQAAACPVCGQGAVETEWAYIVMTAVLSLLPLV